MARSDQGDGEGFTSRWSRRKRKTQAEEPAKPPARGVEPSQAPAGETPASPRDSEIAELPDPDTLDAEADFTVFLRDNVPEALRRRALRRLWRLNPVFANLDGLNDYDDDYTDAATVVEGLKTLYKVGKGFVDDEDVKPEETAQSEGEVAVETADEAPADLEPDPDLTEDGTEGPDSLAAPEAGTDQAGEIAVSGPGNRRRGALARRWGKDDG